MSTNRNGSRPCFVFLFKAYYAFGGAVVKRPVLSIRSNFWTLRDTEFISGRFASPFSKVATLPLPIGSQDSDPLLRNSRSLQPRSRPTSFYALLDMLGLPKLDPLVCA